MKPLDGSALVSTLSLPFIAVYVLWLDPHMPRVPLIHTIGQGFYQGIVFQIVAVMLYSRGVSRLGAGFGVASMAMMPGFGTLMEYAIFGREPSILELSAIVVIAAGVGLVARSSVPASDPR